MGEAAENVNPNVSVGAESKVESRANAITSFDQLDDANVPGPGEKSKEVRKKDDKPAESGKGKSDPKPKEKAADKDDGDTDEGGDDAKAAKKAEAKPDKEAAKTEPKPAKPKVHKYRHGDQTLEISSESVFTLPADGKNVEVTFAELRDNFTGKVHWDRRNNDLHKRETEHNKQVETLNSHIKGLMERASKDPEDAYDWLAELTKQDPVEFKTNMARQQINHVVALLKEELGIELPAHAERAIERYLDQQKLTWREKRVSRVEKQREVESKQTEAQKHASQVKEQYGISDEDYSQAENYVGKYIKEQLKEDRAPTLQEVVYADRQIMALQVIREDLPELEKHGDFAKIVHDIVRDLVETPAMTRDQLRQTLQEVFGEDNSRLQRLSRKAQERAQADSAPSKPASTSDKPVISFADL